MLFARQTLKWRLFILQSILVTYSSVPNLKRPNFCCNDAGYKLHTVWLKGRMATILQWKIQNSFQLVGRPDSRFSQLLKSLLNVPKAEQWRLTPSILTYILRCQTVKSAYVHLFLFLVSERPRKRSHQHWQCHAFGQRTKNSYLGLMLCLVHLRKL